MSFVNICCRVFSLYSILSISGRKEVLLRSFAIPCHLYLLHMNKHMWVLFCDVWCVFLSVPAWAERGEQTWYLQIKPHILWCPTVQVRGPVVFRHKNVMHNMITASEEMGLDSHLMPLLGSLLKMCSKMFIVFLFLYPCSSGALEGADFFV